MNSKSFYKSPIFITAIIIISFVAIYQIIDAIIPFIIGIVIAYAVLPIVEFLENINPLKKRWRLTTRIIAIITTYIIIISVIAAMLLIIIPPTIQEAKNVIESLPSYLNTAQNSIQKLDSKYTGILTTTTYSQLEDFIANIGTIIAEFIQKSISGTLNAFNKLSTLILTIAIIPIFLFYILKDRDRIPKEITKLFPISTRPDVTNIMSEINNVVRAYIQAQLILASAVGLLVFIGLSILGIKFPFFLGFLAAIFALVPILGPTLGAIPGILVTLATHPESIWFVIGVYVITQLFESLLLAPQIHGQKLQLHPTVIMISLMIGSQVAGLFGLVLFPPLVAVLLRIYSFYRRNN